jgi:hypothetical protein
MIKKLVKYGNSTALVLDKAILELLGMTEGSSVKISTDGKSLIVAPAQGSHGSSIEVAVQEIKSAPVSKSADLTLDLDKTLMKVSREVHDETHNLNDPIVKKAMKKMTVLMMERSPVMQRLYSNESFVHELSTKQKSDIAGIRALMYTYEPELKEIDEQLMEVSVIIEPKKEAIKCIQEANRAFEFFNTKGSEYFSSFAQTQNDPEYRHELALITEEYAKTQDKKAYMDAYREIFKRYFPMMDELKSE